MTGCRVGAKNTLVKNYLALAERAGVDVRADTTVTAVREGPDGVEVDVTATGWRPGRARATLRADHVVVAAGAFGTQSLLLAMRERGELPGLSPRLGHLARTNSESLVGAVASDRRVDYTAGVAITSSFFPDPQTHVEPCRYGHGSTSMGLLGTVLTEPGSGPRLGAWLRAVAAHPRDALPLGGRRRWSERAVIGLVMQTVDNSLTVVARTTRAGRVRLATLAEDGTRATAPATIPVANTVARAMARRVRGVAFGNVAELLGRPLTAHYLGGAVIGADASSGVVDAYHRAFGHPRVHVVDGSSVTANPGVNPSLTITAQAERAFAMWPNKGEADPRPAPGSDYRRVAAVAPLSPVVPSDAPGALRLPASSSPGTAAGSALSSAG